MTPDSAQTLPRRRVAVVGGGVVGLSVAVQLGRRGHVVTLFESASSVTGASLGRTTWAAAGILPPANLATATDPIERLRGLSDAAMPAWCDWLLRHTGIDPGYRRCGGIYLAAGPGEAAAMVAQAADWSHAGIACESLTATQLGDRFAALRSSVATLRSSADRPAGWWVPGECQIRPPRLIAALAAAVHRFGTIQTDAHVRGVETIDMGVRIRFDQQAAEFDAAVLCGGASIGRIEPNLRLSGAIVPIRGQMLLMRVPAGNPLATEPMVFNLGNRYVVCRGDGHVLVGSCEEEAGWDESTTPAVLQSLARTARHLFPTLQSSTIVNRWAALRPMTFDGFPMIGPVPRQPGIFVAGGHHRSGVHVSVATATLITEMIERRRPSIDVSAFAVAKQQSN